MKFSLLLPFLFLLSCVSSSQRLSGIQSALTDVEQGRLEQGREGLQQWCTKGSTGACALLGKAVELQRPLPIMQSVTSATSARFVVSVPDSARLTYYRRAPSGEIQVLPHERQMQAPKAIDHINTFNLDLRVSYTLVVVGPDGMLWDQRQFRALDLAGRRARIAVVSGTDSAQTSVQEKVWREVEDLRPNLIFMLGNNVYPEKPGMDSSIESLWQRHFETRASLRIFKAAALIPVMAIWNDLDFGKVAGDRTLAAQAEVRAVFLSFFAQSQAAPHFIPGPGVAGWWSGFGVHFAFLDNRTFRSPNGLELPDQSHFGEAQETWLKQQMQAHPGPVFLISGDPFFNLNPAHESYATSHPIRFKKAQLEWKAETRPLLFMSAHPRFSAIEKVPPGVLGYGTYELITGTLHAPELPPAAAAHTKPWFEAPGSSSFLILELIRSERNFIQFDVRAFGLNKKLHFQKTLMVKR